ncbi:MAG TPA: MGMT family protein, partial [Saprospiraceae bacterium]|nr:MGMT family protein [Saprospiraceae bacterium]
IADYLGLGSARMVGWALKQSSLHGVPANRVVNSKGELSGRHQFNHPDMMATLLNEEKVEVIDNKVVNFKQYFWHPAEGLDY